jgi:hypothetical protein
MVISRRVKPPAMAVAWMLIWVTSAFVFGTSLAQEAPPVTLSVAGRTSATPWIASAGTAIAVSWMATADGKADVFVAVSHDEGRSFAAPVQVNTVAGDGRANGEFPPRVAFGPADGSGRREVVVAWNAKDQGTEVKLARSRDGGRTFAAPEALQAPGAAGDRGWHAMALDDRGVAHVIWLDHRGMTAAKSDGGHKGEHDGVAMAQLSSLYYAAAAPGSRGVERAVSPGVCYCCKTAVVAAPGRIVAAWRHVFAGNMRDIAFTESRDGGRTFRPIARVSEDGWSINGCPDDGPALAVGEDARVHAVWPTVVQGPETSGAIFYAALGTGSSFSARQRVPSLGSPKPSHPQVVVDGSGRVVVAWDEIIGGVRTAAYATGVAQPDGRVTFGPPARIAAGPTAYPVMAVAPRGVVAAWTAGPPTASSIHVRRIDAGDAPSSRAR